MRTNKIFYSIAIATALASCTAEDVMAPDALQQDLSIRPVLGDIELVTTTPSSRLATSEGGIYQPQWLDGDKMGAVPSSTILVMFLLQIIRLSGMLM